VGAVLALEHEPMSQPVHPVRYSYDEYLALERVSNIKHEYLAGQILAMAGGTPDHAAIANNVGTLLNVQLRGRRCRVYTSDLRVRVELADFATYPDVTVVCEREERDPADPNALVNPVVIVEVLSKSTEDYDRGEKFEHYPRIPSLKEYVLVSFRDRAVEVRRREPDGSFTVHQAKSGEVAALVSVGCELSVDEVYRDELAEADRRN
jgi:Uma2 family endonuclease